MPDVVRVERIGQLTEAARGLVRVPDDVFQAIYDGLQGHIGRDLALGDHVEWLAVEGVGYRVNAFVDTDGTLWVTNVGPGR